MPLTSVTATSTTALDEPCHYPSSRQSGVTCMAMVSRAWMGVVICLLLAAAQTVRAQSWQLAWSDEFNNARSGAPPDSSKWTYDVGAGGHGNGELETYCKPGSDVPPCVAAVPNAYQDGKGKLVIQARRDSSGNWTSARLKTQGRFEFQYGRVEARMKLPVGNGLWPAFWMLGSNIKTAPWPGCGENDIMEWVQSYGPETTSSTNHGPGYSGGSAIGAKYTFPNGGRVDSAYHIYGVIWSPDRLQYYRDQPDHVVMTFTPSSIPAGASWAYNHPFFLLLNLAIGGGGFPGATDSSTPATASMLVDYVRVYQQTGRINAGGPSVGAFSADSGGVGGGTAAHSRAVTIPAGQADAAPPQLYQTNRFGNFTYTVSGYRPGSTHTILLYFAELSGARAGQHVFNVSVNGTRKLTNFDIVAAAGASFTASVQQFTATADAGGQYVLQFSTVKGKAQVSGIEVR